MKIKKRMILICVLILSFFSFTACGYHTELKLINQFGIELPKEMSFKNTTRIYDANNQGWFGDGCQYSVFKLKKTPLTIPSVFYKSANASLCKGKIKERINFSMTNLDVPIKYRPEWDKEYYWMFAGKHLLFEADENIPFSRYDDELYLIYQPHNSHLFLFAKFI